jgi:hypothetical protein
MYDEVKLMVDQRFILLRQAEELQARIDSITKPTFLRRVSPLSEDYSEAFDPSLYFGNKPYYKPNAYFRDPKNYLEEKKKQNKIEREFSDKLKNRKPRPSRASVKNPFSRLMFRAGVPGESVERYRRSKQRKRKTKSGKKYQKRYSKKSRPQRVSQKN